MQYKIGKSSLSDAEKAVKEATSGLKAPKLIIFYSGVSSFEAYSKALKEQFQESIVIGSTTYTVLCNEGSCKNQLVVLGIEQGIECFGGVLEAADRYPMKYVERIQNCINQLSDVKNTVCLEFSNALISCEELVVTTLNAALEEHKIPVFGGSAGDAGTAERTMVSLNGKVYDKACVFVLIKNLGGKIKLYRENIYKPISETMIATKVDVKNRIVYEYDGKPAAKVIAEQLGTTVEQLPKYFDSYPMGRIIGNEMYIVANNMLVKGTGIAYHARIYKNSKVVLLGPDNYKEVNKMTRAQVKKDVPHPSLSLMINCLARCMLFESGNYLDEFAKDMGTVLGNYISESGYGEQLSGKHFNQTMVLAVFE